MHLRTPAVSCCRTQPILTARWVEKDHKKINQGGRPTIGTKYGSSTECMEASMKDIEASMEASEEVMEVLVE